MAACRDNEISFACFAPNSGADPVTIRSVTVFDDMGRVFATYYINSVGGIIDPALYLGGGVVTAGLCTGEECEVIIEQTYVTVDGGLCQLAYKVSKVTENGTTVLRFEDANHNTLAGVVVEVCESADCTC